MNSSRDRTGDDGPRAAGASREPDDRRSDAAARLRVVEAEVAFQGDTVRELSDALAAQQMDILTLQRQVHVLGEQLATLRAQVSRAEPDGSDNDPPPPHY